MSAPEGGEPRPIRDFMPLPHQCRCIVYVKDVNGNWVSEAHENRCEALVYEGPDVPLCDSCQEQHWFPGSETILPVGRRLAGLERR